MKNKMKDVLAIQWVAALLLLIGSTPIAAADAATNPFAGNEQAAAEGGSVFGQYCQACHSTRGHGGKCPQLVRGAWGPDGANSDTFMFQIISHGRPNTQMGAFGHALNDEKIWKIIAFLRAEAVRVKEEEANQPMDPEEELWY